MPRKPLPPANEAIFSRIKQVTGVKNGNQLAKYLGIKPASVHAGLHGHIPEHWLYQIAALEHCRVEYLRSGTGLVRDDTGTPVVEFLQGMQPTFRNWIQEDWELLVQLTELLGEGSPEMRTLLRSLFAHLGRR
jgi:hypothetical protein